MAGNWTFANFKSYVTLALGNRDGLTTNLPIWINSAYLQLCSINKVVSYRRLKNLNFPELETEADATTIDGQTYISRPSNTLHIYTIWDMTNDQKLTYRSPSWYFDQTGRIDSNSEGKPKYWIPYGAKTYLHPTPDDAYTLKTFFRKKPSSLVNDGDTTVIGEEWDEAIFQLAVHKGYLHLRDFTTSEIWKKEFLETLERQVGMQDKETIDLKEYFKPDPGYLDFSYSK